MTIKKITFFILASAFVFTDCNSDSNQSKETTVDTAKAKEVVTPAPEQLYACSMHPEVIGKKDEKCPKCGMKLTVPVKQ